MIRRMRMQSVLLAAGVLLVFLVSIIVVINVLNYSTMVTNADATLHMLFENDGRFPNQEKPKPKRPSGGISPEDPFVTRFFLVRYDQDGVLLGVETEHIAALNEEDALALSQEAIASGRTFGFMDAYRYRLFQKGSGFQVIFLDCRRELVGFRNFLFISILISLAGYLATCALIVVLSGKIVAPIALAHEKQKQFIADAGHELKTPLTIIRADADILEMELEDNEWVADIQKQAARLSDLTNDLIYLARMDSAAKRSDLVVFPFSEVITEACVSFQAMAQASGKSLTYEIAPVLSIKGSERDITQLANILLENALKYSPDHSVIRISVKQQGKLVRMSVWNQTAVPVKSEELSHFFERFYRGDTSRSSKISGHGIGLSIAKAIVEAHSGRLSAAADGTDAILITAVFPST